MQVLAYGIEIHIGDNNIYASRQISQISLDLKWKRHKSPTSRNSRVDAQCDTSYTLLGEIRDNVGWHGCFANESLVILFHKDMHISIDLISNNNGAL